MKKINVDVVAVKNNSYADIRGIPREAIERVFVGREVMVRDGGREVNLVIGVITRGEGKKLDNGFILKGDGAHVNHAVLVVRQLLGWMGEIELIETKRGRVPAKLNANSSHRLH